eukprot:4510292-Prymnesium_polylepis.1
MQKESTRTDQTRARNDYGTCPSLTGQGNMLNEPFTQKELRGCANTFCQCARAGRVRGGARTTLHVPCLSDCSSRELRFTLGLTLELPVHFVLPSQSKTLACRASVNPLVSPA